MLLLALVGHTANELLYPAGGQSTEQAQQILQLQLQTEHKSLLAQLLRLTLEFCIAEIWSASGIHPQVVLGCGMGEFAAAVVAGVMSIEDCLTLVSAQWHGHHNVVDVEATSGAAMALGMQFN